MFPEFIAQLFVSILKIALLLNHYKTIIKRKNLPQNAINCKYKPPKLNTMNTLNKILTVVVVTFTTSTFAQKIASTAVPENVMHKFQKDFPTAKDVDWKKDGLNYHADFEIANKDVDVWYSPDAKFIKKKSE